MPLPPAVQTFSLGRWELLFTAAYILFMDKTHWVHISYLPDIRIYPKEWLRVIHPVSPGRFYCEEISLFKPRRRGFKVQKHPKVFKYVFKPHHTIRSIGLRVIM